MERKEGWKWKVKGRKKEKIYDHEKGGGNLKMCKEKGKELKKKRRGREKRWIKCWRK